MRNVILLGYFDMVDLTINNVNSAAAELVQQELFSSLIEQNPKYKASFLGISPARAWPRGKFYIKGRHTNRGRLAAYLNVPILRELWLCIVILLSLLRYRPQVIIQYNSYLGLNLATLCYRFITKNKIGIFIQDLRIGKQFTLRANLVDRISAKLIKYYNYAVPISKPMAQALRLQTDRYTVYPGGVTSPWRKLLNSSSNLEDFCLFAGALEPYNGIDRIVNYWIKNKPSLKLHVFGNGSRAEQVIQAARHNNFIIYHGTKPNETIIEYAKRAKFNWCLRYPDGLNMNFFFPSKFFNFCCAPGLLLINDFPQLPIALKSTTGFLSEFDKLNEILNLPTISIERDTFSRRNWLVHEKSWNEMTVELLNLLDCE